MQSPSEPNIGSLRTVLIRPVFPHEAYRQLFLQLVASLGLSVDPQEMIECEYRKFTPETWKDRMLAFARSREDQRYAIFVWPSDLLTDVVEPCSLLCQAFPNTFMASPIIATIAPEDWSRLTTQADFGKGFYGCDVVKFRTPLGDEKFVYTLPQKDTYEKTDLVQLQTFLGEHVRPRRRSTDRFAAVVPPPLLPKRDTVTSNPDATVRTKPIANDQDITVIPGITPGFPPSR